MPDEHPLAGSIGALPSLGLAEMSDEVALTERGDRKYLVVPEVAVELVESFEGVWSVLETGGSRCPAYRTVYLDDDELSLFHAAARRRRRRVKVRTRHYEATGESFVEVKRTLGRGRSVKNRLATDASDPLRLDDAAADFVAEIAGDAAVPGRLRPTLTTSYQRVTLIDDRAPVRLTVDSDLRCADVDGGAVGLPGRLVVETKSRHRRSDVDRWLWRRGIRPVRFSKYATALAALHPELPDHPWRRTIGLLERSG